MALTFSHLIKAFIDRLYIPVTLTVVDKVMIVLKNVINLYLFALTSALTVMH